MLGVKLENPNICMSGGAKGADSQWGMCAGKLGHTVIHWSFLNHNIDVPETERVILCDDLLAEADNHLLIAAKSLQRTFPTKNEYVNNLLRRNWFQVRDSERLYAISAFKNNKISGGTAWAVQMFLDLKKYPVYFYDQDSCKWFIYDKKWTETNNVPRPFGIWTGIGSRKLNQFGKNAIRSLMDYH